MDYVEMTSRIREAATKRHERRCALMGTFSPRQRVQTPNGAGVIQYLYANGFALVWHPVEENDWDGLGNDAVYGLDELQEVGL